MNIPCEIACNVPTFCIVRNDDLKDTLIGNLLKAHQINVMFTQPESTENKSFGYTDSSWITKSLKNRNKNQQNLLMLLIGERGEEQASSL